MSIPFNTTTITVTRASGGDALDRGAPATVVSGVRAVVSGPSGSEIVTAGASEIESASLRCDPCDLRHGDTVTDDSTGDVWRVTYARKRVGMGIDHMTAGLVAVTDRAAVQ